MPQICKRCLYTDSHPLGITFDEDGICSGCRIHEEKDTLDWSERWQVLLETVAPYKDKTGSNYDCIIPVTGAADSYFMVHVVKNLLGMNPLLVSHNRYFNTPLGIRNLANLRLKFDCDFLLQNVNPLAVKAITRSALNHMGSVYWPVLAGQSVFPVQTAVRFGVPLIIWGAHQGMEQVGMFSHLHEVEMTRRYRKDHDLLNHEAYDMINIFDTLAQGLKTKVGVSGNLISGGQRQIVLIIKAFLKSSQLYILDEPTTGLDGKLKRQVLKLIKDLSKDKTVIIISQDNDIKEIVNRVVHF